MSVVEPVGIIRKELRKRTSPKVIVRNSSTNILYIVGIQGIYLIGGRTEYPWFVCNWYDLKPGEVRRCGIPLIENIRGNIGRFTGKFRFMNSNISTIRVRTRNAKVLKYFPFGVELKYERMFLSILIPAEVVVI
jgi:hypothetical protein